ncbi:MAG: metal ABC transporter permease [Bacteroidales bacterium]|nr:metal ABC transporter permease [Bacteroidales bacterium]
MLNTLLIEIIFTCTIAVIVTLTVRWVGLLIINSLLVLPAAAARNISKNVTIKIPEHFIPSFKPSKSFVNQVKDQVK